MAIDPPVTQHQIDVAREMQRRQQEGTRLKDVPCLCSHLTINEPMGIPCHLCGRPL